VRRLLANVAAQVPPPAPVCRTTCHCHTGCTHCRWELGVIELYERSESVLGIEKVVVSCSGTPSSAF
jgi:hypothetical protein